MHIAMVLRQFSAHGGLELYALQLIKGLLEKDIRVTVMCESSDSNFSHQQLNKVQFEPPPQGASKWQRRQHYYNVASDAVAKNGPFDLVHSQHLGINNADVVTFHNHTSCVNNSIGNSASAGGA